MERNIPIIGGCEDGNASDKSLNNKILTTVSKYMAKHGVTPGAYVYIGDSAMVTENNLKVVGQNLFISRLPATYKECDRVIREAIAQDRWEDVGVIAKTKGTKNRPVAYYRTSEHNVVLYGKPFRAIVVHSSAHDKRRQKRIEKELAKSRQKLEKQIKKETKKVYYCLPDAEVALKKLEALKSDYYEISAQVVEKIIYQRGRPSLSGERKIKEKRYTLSAEVKHKAEVLEQKQREAGCFVLLTNVPKDREGHDENALVYSGKEILAAYKDQHGVERNFGFLKDPLIVNDLFLKKPERIEVLGLILLISLLIWNLMERSMRKYIEESESTLPGWDGKQTNRPTSFMMSTKFLGVMVIIVKNRRHLAQKLNDIQKSYLHALNLTPTVFIDPKPG